VHQHRRPPVVAMAGGQRHIAEADMLDLEAFEHIYFGSSADPRERRRRPRLT
jgi:hypothetical protein